MNLPTREECFELWKEYRMPENIQKHTMAVNKVAVYIAEKLKEKGHSVNVDLVDRAALLHDLDKIHTIKDGKKHGIMAQGILEQLGYPEIALLVKQHILSEVAHLNELSIESKILNYADNRVVHEQIVNLEDKMTYLEKHYNTKITNKIRLHAPKLEKELMGMLDMKPEELQKIDEVKE